MIYAVAGMALSITPWIFSTFILYIKGTLKEKEEKNMTLELFGATVLVFVGLVLVPIMLIKNLLSPKEEDKEPD